MIEKDHQVGVRLLASDFALVTGVALARGETVSDFMRRAMRKELAILGFYDDDVTQALGVTPPRRAPHKPPSRLRYEDRNPTVSFRLGEGERVALGAEARRRGISLSALFQETLRRRRGGGGRPA